MRRGIAILVQAIVCMTLLTGVGWSQASTSTLVVEVVNGTAGGATVVGDTVVLQILRQQQLQSALEADVDERGQAIFKGVPVGPHVVAIARVRHQNMTFQGNMVSLAPAIGDYSTSVRVFDVSSDSSALAVGTHHIMISVQERSLKVDEYMQLENHSDMAIRGSKRDAQGKPVVTEIFLPEGARDLTHSGFLQPSALVATETGFYDTLAVPPGEHQVRFSYRIDIDRGAVNITKGISLPTSELTVFWEKAQGELTGLGEPDERLTNAQGVPVEYYRRHDVPAGDTIAFQISGFNMQTSETATWVALAVAFAVIVAIALWRVTSGAPPAD